MVTTEQWHKLDRFRRSLDRIYQEVAAPNPELIQGFDAMVMSYKQGIMEAGGVDLSDPDEMFGFCSGIAFTISSVVTQTMAQCQTPACFQCFSGHMDLGTQRIALVVRELLKPLVDKGLVPADYQKKPKADG